MQPTCENGNGEVETEEDGSDEEKAGKNEHETPAPPDVLIRIVHEIQKQFQNKRLLEVNMMLNLEGQGVSAFDQISAVHLST